MATELTKAKAALDRARRQIRLQLSEAHLSGYVEALQKFAWEDDQTGEGYVGAAWDRTELADAVDEVVEAQDVRRKKMLEDPDKGPNVAEGARVLLTAIGVYGIESGVAVAALEMVKIEILLTSRESAKISQLHDTLRAAFMAEAPDPTEH